MASLYWAGDSTVAFNSRKTYPQTGIGQVFSLFTQPEIMVKNNAINGRSTKSFIDEGRLDQIDTAIQPGDFLFIQFGHNDEKERDPLRFTEAATSFKQYLSLYLDVAEAHHAFPLLITPLERMIFEENHLVPSAHLPYVQAMREVAEERAVALVDLFARSRKAIDTMGEEKSCELFMHIKPHQYENYPLGKDDNTHLQQRGAVYFASLLAEEIAKLPFPYTTLLLE